MLAGRVKRPYPSADESHVSDNPLLPTQAGPVPDRLTIWPVDDGRYGLDATFHGSRLGPGSSGAATRRTRESV